MNQWPWNIGGMILSGENRSSGKNPAPLSLRTPQVSHGLTWDRVQSLAVRALTNCLSHDTVYFIFRRVPITAKCDWLLHVCPSLCLSIRNNSAPTGRIFVKFDIWRFLEILSIKFKSHYNRTRIPAALCEDLWWHLAEIFLNWEMFQKKVAEKIKFHNLKVCHPRCVKSIIQCI